MTKCVLVGSVLRHRSLPFFQRTTTNARAHCHRGLMTPEKFENLGFKGGFGADTPQAAAADAANDKEKQDKKQGFLAGQRYAEKRGTGSTSF